jgi:hypothetical protein
VNFHDFGGKSYREGRPERGEESRQVDERTQKHEHGQGERDACAQSSSAQKNRHEPSTSAAARSNASVGVAGERVPDSDASSQPKAHPKHVAKP